MTILMGSTFANALLQHTGTSVADQLGAGTLVGYSGTAPAGPNEALSGNTVLFTFTFGSAAAQGTPSGGTMTLALSASTVSAAATGTATFFRIISSGSTALVQGTISTAGADWNLSSTSITSGDNVTITGTPSISWPVF